MGKTKTKIMDDSQLNSDEKPKKKRRDELVESLKAELATDSSDPATGGTESVDSKPVTDKVKVEPKSEKKTTKVGKTKPRSKKYQEAAKDLDKSKSYSLIEAVEMAKKLSYSKFNGTLDIHINTLQSGIRGLVSLPFSSGKKLRILVFGSTSSGKADSEGLEDVIIGSDDVIGTINKGKIDFDLVISTSEWMPKLAKVARILGPRGLMPNPKNGTIVTDLKKAVLSFQSGKTEYKTEAKASVIHLGLGKLNQPNEELSANVKTLLQTLGKSRVKKVTLSPTMGPSVKLDISSI